jgi:isopentenyl diphosphate isomerase/L-lactate dehydrogenase-like FMN-dependent dehydrogenase
MINRRQALQSLFSFAAASPLWSFSAPAGPQRKETIFPPNYGGEVMGPVNLHEMEEVARKKLHKLAYDFVAGGVEDELTLRANREAITRIHLRPRVMVDVSKIDTSLELLGKKLEYPILLAPTGGKELVIPDGDLHAAKAAAATKTVYVASSGGYKREIKEPIEWWQNTIGQSTKAAAQGFAKRSQDAGATAICVTVDNQYQSNRDRNNRNKFDYGYMATGVPAENEKREPVSPAVAAMLQPKTPNMTWDYIDWLKSACSLPVILKGILTAEDARLAVEHRADAVIVSNHGGRQLDGVLPTIEALPPVVEAVQGRIPVLVDGGIRRGSDVLKALALGAKAVLIGRPYVWGLAAFGQIGVQRVVDLLRAELALSMGLAGKPTLASIDRRLVRLPGEKP